MSTAESCCNIGHICTAQQCADGLSSKIALRYVSAKWERADYTFGDLDCESNRVANALISLGVVPGEVVFTYLAKAPEQFFVFLGALKAQAVCGTLFSNFGEDALFDRLADSRARVVFTQRALVGRIERIRDRLPCLMAVVLIDAGETVAGRCLDYRDVVGSASPDFKVGPTLATTPSVIHYTSGSTGRPKGVLHSHHSLVMQAATTRDVLGLTVDDIYWCTADQGWVTGTSYGIIGPWACGVTQVQFAGSFSAENWRRVLEDEHISVWYTAPTALRMLMRDTEIFSGSYPALRAAYSVGEPLNPEVLVWARGVLGLDVHDTWFQTETGAIMIANRPGLTVRPGSMGKPVAGVRALILDEAGAPLPPGHIGNLCLEADWPSMFVAYLNNPSAYQAKFRSGVYYTGDTAYVDTDGYFWFCGRSDDVINTAGHLVSPFEVESVLLEEPGVIESGVVGCPDPELFEKVVAFVHVREGVACDQKLVLRLRVAVGRKMGSYAAPQVVIFVDGIPKNKSGKIMRRVLRAMFLGEDPGDLSTMEG